MSSFIIFTGLFISIISLAAAQSQHSLSNILYLTATNAESPSSLIYTNSIVTLNATIFDLSLIGTIDFYDSNGTYLDTEFVDGSTTSFSFNVTGLTPGLHLFSAEFNNYACSIALNGRIVNSICAQYFISISSNVVEVFVGNLPTFAVVTSNSNSGTTTIFDPTLINAVGTGTRPLTTKTPDNIQMENGQQTSNKLSAGEWAAIAISIFVFLAICFLIVRRYLQIKSNEAKAVEVNDGANINPTSTPSIRRMDDGVKIDREEGGESKYIEEAKFEEEETAFGAFDERSPSSPYSHDSWVERRAVEIEAKNEEENLVYN